MSNNSNDNSDNSADEKIYWDLVEEFIQLANAKSEQVDIGLIASALMQASSRFAAFYVAGSSEDRKTLKDDKDTLIQDLSRAFKKEFAENLEDYIENYKIYLGEPK